MRIGFSGERIESESDSVPETACWDVVMPGPKCFYKDPGKVTEVDSDVSVHN